jgi:uncharacterized membrane protein
MTIKVDTKINAPIEKVFDTFADISSAQDIISGITKIDILSDVKSGVGTRWRETRVMFGKEATEEMEITDLQKNAFYTVEADSHGTKYKTVFEFESEDDNSTLVTMTFEGKPYTFGARIMGIMWFLLKGATKKALGQDMLDLKKYCEGKN